jgi:D-beta-D-heptose 7-phosphate kinase/D-beta-D-heptose 1-phosphate adenosyltransferase
VLGILQPRHLDLQLGAPRAGDHLVVGLNSDASVRRLKGPERPVRNEAERAYVLAAFEMVDCVVLFEQDTPLELIRLLEPDVLVKGGDYSEDSIVGAPDVRSRGGEVLIIPLTPGQSTTSIIRKLRGHSGN